MTFFAARSGHVPRILAGHPAAAPTHIRRWHFTPVCGRRDAAPRSRAYAQPPHSAKPEASQHNHIPMPMLVIVSVSLS